MTGRGDEGAATHGQNLNEALLASLGLPRDATPADVRATRDRLREYLTSAPPELRPWAEQQLAAAEAACAVLDDADPPPAVLPTLAPSPGEAGADLRDVVGDDADGNPFRWARHPKPAVASAAPRRLPVGVLLGLVAIGVAVGVWLLGDAPRQDADTAAGPAETAVIDEARVAELEAAVAADPYDTDALRELGAMHYAAGDFATAASWTELIVDAHPDDVDARLALGVALFSQGDLEGAEEHWLAAAALAPDLPEVHYNLGFLHLSKDPPDMDGVFEEWNRVVELDPDSALAATVATHLEQFEGTPSPSPTGD